MKKIQNVRFEIQEAVFFRCHAYEFDSSSKMNKKRINWEKIFNKPKTCTNYYQLQFILSPKISMHVPFTTVINAIKSTAKNMTRGCQYQQKILLILKIMVIEICLIFLFTVGQRS